MKSISKMGTPAACLTILACTAALGGWAAAVAPDVSKKLHLGPRFETGQVIRYRLESSTTTVSHHSGIVNDPQGPSKLTVNWSATVRMEVLAAAQDSSGMGDSSVRIRTTYEKSSATSTADTYDPETERVEAQYRNLEGQSFEFMLDGSGNVMHMSGFQESAGDSSTAAMHAWVGQLAAGAGAPRDGIVVGQTWSSEQPVPASPLAGLIWRSHSEYARNEPCKPLTGAAAPAPTTSETCAVLLTNLDLGGSRGPEHDATPEVYKKQSLRTSGTWTGTGSSLSSISLRTGGLVSVTQSSAEHMDFTVKSEDGGRTIHYQGSVQSHMQLEQVSPSAK
jgi:hypothetical protein